MRLIAFLLLSLFIPVLAEEGDADPALNPKHPDHYEVISGDTLWDIAGKLLLHPWRWQDLWHANPQVTNPNLIYPGDTLTLTRVNGRMVPGLIRGNDQQKIALPVDQGTVVKLSPKIRKIPLVQPIPTIPITAIQPFLSHIRVTALGQLEQAAYVIGQMEHRLASAAGDAIYVRGLPPETVNRYGIYRAGRPYYRPVEKGQPELLGIEAIAVGEAEIEKNGDIATLRVTRSDIEILPGDRLLPEETEGFNQQFMPHAPHFFIEGQILDVPGGVSRIGKYQTVALDRGREEGLEIGHVFAVYQSGHVVTDLVTQEVILLPEEQAGLVMVFRVFDRISYALVLEAQREMRIHDVIRPPSP